MKFRILGNPENRRVSLFAEALQSAGLAPPQVLPYAGFIRNPDLPGDTLQEKCVFRIDSPGENEEVRRLLILQGMRREKEKQEEVSRLTGDFGRVGYGREWYNGFAGLLKTIGQKAQAYPQIRWMNTPQDIRTMFDKQQCHALFLEKNIPVPALLPEVFTYEALKSEMRKAGKTRVFVKPAHGSSASGVVAFRMQKEKMEAISSAEAVEKPGGIALYNSLKIRSYKNENEIAGLLDSVFRDKAIVEEWIPKAGYKGQVFDLRILVIGGKACHTVVRRSKSPITNLHLGNKRGLTEDVVALIGKSKMEEARFIAEQAAACFPGSLYIAADVLIASDRSTIKILEVNAFGDLLPGILHNGESTYTAEINALLQNDAG
ncbi:MAG: hypothetical protein FD123_575 [Bacteroidetes bacterium]|nr:MAG: hypothetical protein FD123_575 [Bacteroidota bacterium]